MIIGLTGKLQSGKDTVGAYLVTKHNFQRRAFADSLKDSFCALLDIDRWVLEDLKNQDNAIVAIGYKNEPENCPPDHMWSPIRELSVREALQRYGTEAHREIFGSDFWVNATLPVGGYYTGRAIVITDCRFDNEASRIKELGGVVWQIVRPRVPVSGKPHRSEQGIDPALIDEVIRNYGTLEDLYEKVELCLSQSRASSVTVD